MLPEQKLIYLALWQNPQITAAGAYFLDVSVLAVSLGFATENLEKAILEFEEKGLVNFDKETSEIIVRDWFRFHAIKTDTQVAIVQKAVDKIESDQIRNAFFDKIKHVSLKIIDLRPNTTEHNSSLTEPQQNAEAGASSVDPALQDGGGGQLIFEREIDKKNIEEMRQMLAGVEIDKAQQMLDVLAKYGDKVKNPILFLQSLIEKIAKNDPKKKFDPTPGDSVSKRRLNEAAEREKRKMEYESRNKPRHNPALGKPPLVNCLV